MGHFRESSYAYLLFKNDTILTSFNTPHPYIKERQQKPPSTPKIISTLFLPVTYKGEVISASRGARELILFQIESFVDFLT